MLLIHLRRIIMLLSVVYMSGAAFRRLISGRHHGHVLQPLGTQSWLKPVHFQWWAYIYVCYTYFVLANCVNLQRLTNLLEFLLADIGEMRAI